MLLHQYLIRESMIERSWFKLTFQRQTFLFSSFSYIREIIIYPDASFFVSKPGKRASFWVDAATPWIRCMMYADRMPRTCLMLRNCEPTEEETLALSSSKDVCLTLMLMPVRRTYRQSRSVFAMARNGTKAKREKEMRRPSRYRLKAALVRLAICAAGITATQASDFDVRRICMSKARALKARWGRRKGWKVKTED